MDVKRRSNEPAELAPLPRQNRFLVNREGYFYRTRECERIGPFSSESEAVSDLKIFIKATSADSSTDSEPSSR